MKELQVLIITSMHHISKDIQGSLSFHKNVTVAACVLVLVYHCVLYLSPGISD